MRILKIGLIALILCSIVIPPISCGKKAETIPESQLVTVQRGNLTVDITASGNLAYPHYEDLAFQIGGTVQNPLSVEAVLVQEGDSVKEGQVLATLDTTSLNQDVKTAEQAAQKAEIDFESARSSYVKLTYPYDYRTFKFDVPAAVALTTDVQRELKEAITVMQEMGLSGECDWQKYWDAWNNLKRAQDKLMEARDNLIRGYGPDVFTSGIVPMADFWTLRAAQLAADKAQVALDEANDALAIAKDRLGKTVIVAPFAGFVTTVNVKGGDQVQRGTVAMRLVDPNKFEAEVMVSEMDIFQVKVGGDATVQIEAMPTLILPAKVTHISPTATITSGVVNYKVKVEIQLQEGQEDFQLREGLTVTVSIIVQQKTNVLLVPNGAITSRGEKTYVQVVSAEGVAEEREITTGISNWQYTEVTSGLSEGERVVVPEGTATTTPTTEQPRGPMPFFGPPPR